MYLLKKGNNKTSMIVLSTRVLLKKNFEKETFHLNVKVIKTGNQIKL